MRKRMAAGPGFLTPHSTLITFPYAAGVPRRLTILPEPLAVCRLKPDAARPAWARGRFVSITRTSGELSIVCAAKFLPKKRAKAMRVEEPFRALTVAGPIDLGEIGVLHALLGPLAAAGVGVLAISTFDTDHLLVREADLPAAVAALRAAGLRVG